MEGGLRRVATRMGEMEELIAVLICGCGVPAHLRTSWSNDNPGRSMGVIFGGFTGMGVGFWGITGMGDSDWFLLG
ncbi:hypothetical protein V6N12_030087 [Hibiscus sabdariffa]|uniref:Uncharacterized protein n=1 Tax=Hibiscus sabdariffa TaxID=183260 RepID=A0ABR2CJT6_9ROSI